MAATGGSRAASAVPHAAARPAAGGTSNLWHTRGGRRQNETRTWYGMKTFFFASSVSFWPMLAHTSVYTTSAPLIAFLSDVTVMLLMPAACVCVCVCLGGDFS